MLKEKIDARALPELMRMANGQPVVGIDDWRARRRELIDLLSREEYGYTPAAPAQVRASIDMPSGSLGDTAYANKAIQQKIDLSFDTPNGEFTFPFRLIVPKAVSKAPVFVYINFRPDVPDRYLPVEEIIDNGFAIAVFYYKDVTDDSGNFDKLATMYPRDEKTGWGKIGMWAFAASRIMDYLESREDIDCTRACVSGHSRLGKTALWCGAQDERFAMVISNCSGCSGAAITRDKVGEDVDTIARVFPYWFCGNYQAWRCREKEMPFDQHMLLALVAPRKLYVASAEEDTWADPESEFLCCVTASEAWTAQRAVGLITPDAMPELNAPLHEGGICYHVRTGSHYHSRTDWIYHMQCRQKAHI